MRGVLCICGGSLGDALFHVSCVIGTGCAPIQVAKVGRFMVVPRFVDGNAD